MTERRKRLLLAASGLLVLVAILVVSRILMTSRSTAGESSALLDASESVERAGAGARTIARRGQHLPGSVTGGVSMPPLPVEIGKRHGAA